MLLRWCRSKLDLRKALLLALVMLLFASPGRANGVFGSSRNKVLLSVLGTAPSSGHMKELKIRKEESQSNRIQHTVKNDLQKAEQHAQEDRILASTRLLRRAMAQQSNKTRVPSHQKILEVADRIEEAILDLSSLPDPKIWNEVRGDGKSDVLVHYKLDEKRRLTGRIEFLIEKALLVPLLATLVETELYYSWVPRWRFPPVGIKQVRKLAQTGRTNQVIQADLEIPWKRDVIIGSTGVEDVDENGLIGIHLGPLPEGQEIGDSGVKVPSPEKGVERVFFEGCFVFQRCPNNHPVVLKHTTTTRQASDNNQPTTTNPEEMILVGFSMFVDAKLSTLFPQVFANFIVRVAMVRLFQIFLNVAEDVHAGLRPDHTAAIASKRGYIYNWIEERVNVMFDA